MRHSVTMNTNAGGNIKKQLEAIKASSSQVTEGIDVFLTWLRDQEKQLTEAVRSIEMFRTKTAEVLDAMVDERPPTKQVRYKQERVRQGLCAGCGSEPIFTERSTSLGEKCLEKQRRRMARRRKDGTA